MSDLARETGIGRPTLYKHEAFIENLRDKLDIERRRSEGNARVVALQEELDQKSANVARPTAKVECLQMALANMYEVLFLEEKDPLASY